MSSQRIEQARGQSTVELSLCVVVLLILVMGLLDLGIHVASSNKIPPAARAGALLLTPSNNQDGVAVRPTTAMQEIIRAGASQSTMDLHKNAQITVSYVQKVSGVSKVTYQYVKAPNAAASVDSTAVWTSRLGALNADVSAKIPPAMLANDSDWVVVVEVFYQPQYLTPLPKLTGINTTDNFIYEIAIF